MIRPQHLLASSILALATAVMPGAAIAQAPADTATDAAETDIIVTGTRTIGRSKLETSAPVDVLSGNALRSQGTTELAQALANVAPAITFPRSAAVDATESIRPATLRGLSPDQTLVLVNGIRGHSSALLNINGSVGRGSSAFDLNTIPTVALDRVEVLRDGASAQYGSDAIAGVINLRLRQARSGGGATVSYGQYETNVDAFRTSYKAHDGKTYNVSAWQGFGIGSDGFLTISGDYLNRGRTNRGDNDIRVAPARVTSQFGDPKVEQYSVFANLGVPVGDVWSIYGFGGYQHRDSTGTATPRLAGADVLPGFTNANSVTSLFPSGYVPQINIRSDDINSALGLRGEIADWNVDVSVSYGRNELALRTQNSVNSTYGAASPTDFYDGKLIYDQIIGGLDVSKKYDIGGDNTLNVAAGLEYRREGFTIRAGQVESYARGPLGSNTALGSGAQGFQGFTPANAGTHNRDNFSGYLDLEAQFGKLLLGAAVRGESYSDFGETATFKGSARYDFDEHFALRATASTGFKAPSLQQQYYSVIQPVLNGGVPADSGLYPSVDPIAVKLGGKPLQPERSVNLSGGLVFRWGGFDVSVDVYHIKIRNQLALSENLGTGVNATPEILASLPVGVSSARFFVNGIRSHANGLDLVAHYRLPTNNAGTFDATFAANFNEVSIDSVPTGTGTIAVPAIFGQQRIVAFERGTPRSKLTGQIDWSLGKFGLLARTTYYGSVTQSASVVADYADTGDRAIVDLEGRVTLFDRATLSLGANNLLDNYPQAVPSTKVNNYNNGVTAFPFYSPFGFNGRYLYARLGVTW